MITTVVFIIQIFIVIAVILYIYITFRHIIQIPTAEKSIEQISPGLMQLTAKQDKVVFWFYSLSAKRYKQYTLDSEMNIQYNDEAIAPPQVVEPNSSYYYNFGLQRWEKKIPHADTPSPIITDNDSIEQKFTLCYIYDNDQTEICDDIRNQTFIKTSIDNSTFIWKDGMLTEYAVMVFPTSVNICKFTMNRYRQYLGLSINTISTSDNIEQEMGVYFEKDTNDNWRLKECERPYDMIFNGSMCIEKTSILSSRHHHHRHTNVVRLNEEFTRNATYSDLAHTENKPLNSYYIQFNPTYSTYVNLNVDNNLYNIDTPFYKSCSKTIFLVGDTTDNITYSWHMEQIINNSTRVELLKMNQRLCPILNDPFKMLFCRGGEIMRTPQQFIIYRNRRFIMEDFVQSLVGAIYASKDYTIVNNYYGGMISNYLLLPHTRKYLMKNSDAITCEVYCVFVGEIIYDVYLETRLLIDYVDDIHNYNFYRCTMFPIIKDDFQLDTWSCAQDVSDPDMFTYISLVDIYGLEEFATID